MVKIRKRCYCFVEKRTALCRARAQCVCKFESALCALCFLNQSVIGVRLQKTDIPRTLSSETLTKTNMRTTDKLQLYHVSVALTCGNQSSDVSAISISLGQFYSNHLMNSTFQLFYMTFYLLGLIKSLSPTYLIMTHIKFYEYCNQMSLVSHENNW